MRNLMDITGLTIVGPDENNQMSISGTYADQTIEQQLSVPSSISLLVYDINSTNFYFLTDMPSLDPSNLIVDFYFPVTE